VEEKVTLTLLNPEAERCGLLSESAIFGEAYFRMRQRNAVVVVVVVGWGEPLPQTHISVAFLQQEAPLY
jgi:hypothetical protein